MSRVRMIASNPLAIVVGSTSVRTSPASLCLGDVGGDLRVELAERRKVEHAVDHLGLEPREHPCREWVLGHVVRELGEDDALAVAHRRARDRGARPVDERARVEVHRRLEQRLLAREVGVDRGRGQLRLAGDVRHRGPAVPVEREAAHGDLEQEAPRPVALGAADVSCRVPPRPGAYRRG